MTAVLFLVFLVVPFVELFVILQVGRAIGVLNTPGFVTDVVGILLMLPPVRAAVRATVTRRLRRRADFRSFGPGSS